MFTWNFQYVSKARLAETFGQLMLEPNKGDILIHIHTAIHSNDEAVDLARFVKKLVPSANIIGTSTSATVSFGKLVKDQCTIAVSQMSEGHIKTAMLTDVLSCDGLRESLIDGETTLLVSFIAGEFKEADSFVKELNMELPGISMIGGIVDISDNEYQRESGSPFVFNENGWSDHAVLCASLGGRKLSAIGGYATGAMVVESEEANADVFREASEGSQDLLDLIHFTDDGRRLCNSYEKTLGLKMAFLYDDGIVSDNRKLFRRIEGFPNAETLFGYICASRVRVYPASTGWELSAYENSNLCGCVTNAVIVADEGRNILSDWAFAVSAAGEREMMQKYNPYVFSHTEVLSEDDRRLLSYIMEIEKKCEKDGSDSVSENIMHFVRVCEKELLSSAEEGLPNSAALNMDMRLKGYDRICIINVLDTEGIKAVFPDSVTTMTRRTYIGKCSACANNRNYRIYKLDKWQLAIAAPSYMVKLSEFIKDMEELQRELFKTAEDTVAIVPTFCILDDRDPDHISDDYSSACNRMQKKNIQFYVYNDDSDRPDEDSIRERYHMVDVINYALDHDKVLPYYQGIYDNRESEISHYEALMRIEDEKGRVYYPGEFLDVARSYGLLYDSMSAMMIRKVFDKFSAYDDKVVSINLGIRDIRNRELVEYICGFLSTAKHPENFVFEILENEDVDDYEYLLDFVDRIHSLGGRISIDDFGSGYSNLLHIIRIHLDYLKIDGSIVRRCSTDRESENIIAMISGWKKQSSRKIDIVAEYVENSDIQKMIEKYNIDYSQGYLFAKPTPEIEED
ncbi:MAG: EAL domain-containing protein [Lachnospiraceae bacterium]|nr:EAL domain-containing protein [Lachnospiraceae bacterium]